MNVSVLVPSWDGYADLWEPFFASFFRYWPDCPWPVYLGTNSLEFDHDRVQVIHYAGAPDYSSNLIGFLNDVPTEWVIVWIEDLMLHRPVDMRQLDDIVRWAIGHDVDHLRLWPASNSVVSRAAKRFPNASFPVVGWVPPGTRYRAGLTVGLWRKSVLLDLLSPGESAWDFEFNASRRSADRWKSFWCLLDGADHPAPISVVNTVRKGLWTTEGMRFMKRHGMASLIHTRTSEPPLQSFVRRYVRGPLRLIVFDAAHRLSHPRSSHRAPS